MPLKFVEDGQFLCVSAEISLVLGPSTFAGSFAINQSINQSGTFKVA